MIFVTFYRHIFGIVFIMGLILSISPITAHSIETQNNNSNCDMNVLTQFNHMEVMPLKNTTNKEKKIENSTTKTRIYNKLGEANLYDIYTYIIHIIGTLMVIIGIIIVMRNINTVPTVSKLCLILSLGMVGTALKCLF